MHQLGFNESSWSYVIILNGLWIAYVPTVETYMVISEVLVVLILFI